MSVFIFTVDLAITIFLPCAVYKHRTIISLATEKVRIGEGAFIAPSAAVIGDVTLGNRASVWYGTILRGAPLVSSVHLDAVVPCKGNYHDSIDHWLAMSTAQKKHACSYSCGLDTIL